MGGPTARRDPAGPSLGGATLADVTTSPNPSKRERREAARAARQEAERAAAAGATRRRRLTMLLVALGAAAVLVVVGIAVSSGGKDDAASRPAAAQQAAGAIPGEKESAAMLEGIPQNGTVLGDPGAPVKLVEFADLQCPICREHALQVLPVIVRDYVRTGKVQIDLRMIPIIGEDSIVAERAAAGAAQQDKLWNFSDVFFYNQGQENSGYVTDAFLQRIYRASGVDATKADAYAASAASGRDLEAAVTMANRYRVDGTPTFLVGRKDGTLTKLDAEQNGADGLAAAIDGLLS